jgi:hypothetical protein
MKPTVLISSLLIGLALLLGTGSAVAQKAGPPNVVGMKLPAAETKLEEAGWAPRPFNTDTLFDTIIVKAHYTVCQEYSPIGRRVRILAQKYGC